MLKNIPSIISPKLLKILMEMGHGDEIVISDGNFPAAAMAQRLVRLDGHGVPEVLEAVLELMPLDIYVDEPVALMEVVKGDTYVPEIWDAYKAIIKEKEGQKKIANEERFAFYERAKKAYAVVATGETSLYANIILKKRCCCLMKDLLLAIDQGTSGCKMTIFDITGQVVCSITKAYNTYYPAEGYVEQKPEEWWQVIQEGIATMLEERDIDPTCIKGIGIDGTGWACIPIDQSGHVLHPAMIWLDRRAEKQANWMKQILDEAELIALSGNPVDPAYITPKMLWLKENMPDLYKKTDKFIQSNAYIALKLTGKLSQEYSQCYGFHFF